MTCEKCRQKRQKVIEQVKKLAPFLGIKIDERANLEYDKAKQEQIVAQKK